MRKPRLPFRAGSPRRRAAARDRPSVSCVDDFSQDLDLKRAEELRHLGFRWSRWQPVDPTNLEPDYCEICRTAIGSRASAEVDAGFLTVDHERLWVCGDCFGRLSSQSQWRDVGQGASDP